MTGRDRPHPEEPIEYFNMPELEIRRESEHRHMTSFNPGYKRNLIATLTKVIWTTDQNGRIHQKGGSNMQTATKSCRLPKTISLLGMLFGLTSLLGQPQTAGSLPEPKEDNRQVRRIQRDIAHDQKRLNRDTLKFGANSSQVLRDQADLQ